MKKEFSYYRQVTKELIAAGKSDRELYQKIDKLFKHEWELPTDVADLPGMRKFTSTDAHDSMIAGIKTIAASEVYLDVLSPVPGEDNARIADEYQVALQHQWELMKKRTVTNPFWEMANHAVKYDKIALQLEHIGNLPVKGKKKKYIERYGDFALVVHDPASVYEKYSYYGMDSVVLVQEMLLADVRANYGDEMAEKIIEERKKNDDLAIEEHETYAVIYDWTDYDDRIVWAEISDTLDGGSEDSTILKDETNKLPFINWIVRRADDPLMKAIVETDLIKNFDILWSLRYYTIAALAAWPRMWSRTPTGEGVDVNWKDVGGQVQLRVGEEAGMNPPPAEDTGAGKITNEVQAKIYQATQIARSLTSLESIAPGTAFSTINAMREAGIASLGEILRIIKDGMEDMFCHMLYWSQYMNKPLFGRRSFTTDPLDSTLTKGASFYLDLQDAEIEKVELIVELRPDTMTDKQGRFNVAIMGLERLHLDYEKVYEIAGIKNGKQSHESWKQQQIELAELEAEKKRIIGAVDVEIQNAMSQMQMQQQQQMQQPPPQPSQGQPQFSAAQGMDNRGGGLPAAQVAPQATREQVTGRDTGGNEVV